MRGRIYYEVFRTVGQAYQELTALTVAQAINLHVSSQRIGEYKVTVLIDGLQERERLSVGKRLRVLGVKTRKVRGARDENEAAIRLADAIAGMIRAAEEGDAPPQAIKERLDAAEIVYAL